MSYPSKIQNEWHWYIINNFRSSCINCLKQLIWISRTRRAIFAYTDLNGYPQTSDRVDQVPLLYITMQNDKDQESHLPFACSAWKLLMQKPTSLRTDFYRVRQFSSWILGICFAYLVGSNQPSNANKFAIVFSLLCLAVRDWYSRKAPL